MSDISSPRGVALRPTSLADDPSLFKKREERKLDMSKINMSKMKEVWAKMHDEMANKCKSHKTNLFYLLQQPYSPPTFLLWIMPNVYTKCG